MNAKLTVLTGTQQGAVAWLMPGASLSVGSSLDDDVVLRDVSIERRHALLLLKDNQLTLSCESASCLADGVSIEPGKSVVLANNALLQMGDIGLAINFTPSSQDAYSPETVFNSRESDRMEHSVGLQEQHATANPQAASFMPSVDNLPAFTADSPNSPVGNQPALPTRDWVPRTLTVSALLICAAIVWQSGLFVQQPVEKVVDLQSAISTLSLAGVSLQQSGTTVTVSGYVDTVQESKKLAQWLDQTGSQITNNVFVGEFIGEQVYDVFRVHGIPAEVRVNDGVNVVVATNEAQLDRLNTVEERVKQDVPGIVTLTINNVLPDEVHADEPMPIDPGKRVAMVVSGEPSVVITVDESRYYVDSLLPTGHHIVSIEEGVVTLVKNGNYTKMEF